MVEPFCLTNFSATSYSTRPVAARLARQGEKANPHYPCRFCMSPTQIKSKFIVEAIPSLNGVIV